MTNDDFNESPLDKAVKRQKELQETIKAATETIKSAMQELEKLRQFTDLYRSFSVVGETESRGGSDSSSAPAAAGKLKGRAYGHTQAVFEALVLDILREVGRPIRSGEFIEEFRKRGQPLGGNEVRTAWNRLWEARKSGLLTHDMKLGYWIAGEPLSDEAKARAREIAKKRPRSGGPSLKALSKGKPKGPPRALTPEDVQDIERLLLAGKSRREVCDLYGIAMNTLADYVGRTDEFLARHPGVVIPKRPHVSRPRKTGAKPLGRRPKLSDEKAREAAEMKAQGKSVQEIADTLGVQRSTIYHTLKRLERSDKS